MREAVADYYGKTLKSSSDLKTNACTTPSGGGEAFTRLLANIHEDVKNRYYGCGLVYPAELEGLRILDLGCGSGLDCFVLAQLVGPQGSVVGVDMTDEQLHVADSHVDWHMNQFGYDRSNVNFMKGYLEKLDELELSAGEFDLIVSNCVINLAIDKPAVLKSAHELLAPGGEMYFSDVYSDRRIPPALSTDPVLYGECLSGAFYWNDFEQTARDTGFLDPRLVEDRPLGINDPGIAAKIGHIGFHSATYRLFKLSALESVRQDYGQAVRYRGTLAGSEHCFDFDAEHRFEAGKVYPVCGNTQLMLEASRFNPHFEFFGNRDTHFGIFPGSAIAIPFAAEQEREAPSGGSCC
ncbi:MAG: methyltransferase domain-containing protein [Pseudomonadota bacterium]